MVVKRDGRRQPFDRAKIIAGLVKACEKRPVPAARIEEIVLPIVRDHGLELVDLEWRALRPRGVLRLYVDKPGGVAVADCERLSREAGDVIIDFKVVS